MTGQDAAAETRAMQAGERLLRSTIENMLEGVQVIDHDWRYAYLNPQAEIQARRPKETLLGRVFQEEWPGVEDTELFTCMKRCMEERLAERMENIFVYPDGSAGVFELSIQPVPEGIVILSSDVTERHEAEKALRESEERYRQMAENITDVIWVLDLATMHFTHVSPSVERLRGYTVAEVMQQPLQAAITPESLERVSALLRESLACLGRGEPLPEGSIDVDQPCKDGTMVTTEVTSKIILDGEGKPVQVLGVSRDVTERRAAERALRIAKEDLEGVMNALPDLMFRFDREGRIVDYHSACDDLLYLPPEQFVGKRFSEVLPEHAVRVIQGALDEALAYGAHRGAAYDLPVGNETHWFELSIGAMGGESGDFIVLVRDVTERVRLEEQLREAQKLEAVGLLAGGIAHQYNNMLASIIGYADWLLDDPQFAGTKAQQYLQIIKREGRRAADLTQELLTLSQKHLAVPSVVSINDLVGAAESDLRALLRENVRLALSLDAAAGRVTVDPRQLKSVLASLADNANDAMPEGGELKVATTRAELDERTADALRVIPGAYALLTVSDTGTGIAPETMARLFEPFFTTKAQGKGVGLGLPVVRGIVRQSRGGISVSSAQGEGTIVRIYLPQADGSGAFEKQA